MVKINPVKPNLQTRQGTKPHNKISFGQITPNHLFVKIKGYEQNMEWATIISKFINTNSRRLQLVDIPYKKLLGKIEKIYSKAIKSYNSNWRSFGTKSYYESYVDFIQHGQGKYVGYSQRALDFVKKFAKEESPTRAKNLIDINGKGEKKFHISTMEAVHDQPQITTTQPHLKGEVFNYQGEIFKKLMSLKGSPKNAKTMKAITENIAKIHWSFAHAMPYLRGSAGIADVLCKTLFEALGVQVAPWKKNVAPDLEAFVTPLEEFVNKYPKLFEKPPVFIRQKKGL